MVGKIRDWVHVGAWKEREVDRRTHEMSADGQCLSLGIPLLSSVEFLGHIRFCENKPLQPTLFEKIPRLHIYLPERSDLTSLKIQSN